jgi:putative serine protease PepD
VTGHGTDNVGIRSSYAVGDPVVALGSPCGLAGTVTSGILSAIRHEGDDLIL